MSVPIKIFTSPTVYTPTFIGFGTVTNINVTYHFISAELVMMRASFTTGTNTATQARMSLPAGMTIAASVTSPDYCGTLVQKLGGWGTNSVLATPNSDYLIFAHDNMVSQNLLTPLNGNDFLSNVDTAFIAFLHVKP